MAKRTRKTLKPSAPVTANVPVGAHLARETATPGLSPLLERPTLGVSPTAKPSNGATGASGKPAASAAAIEGALDKTLAERANFLSIGDDRLVAIDGVHGLFTPIATADAKDADSAKNLLEVVAVLKREVAALRDRNLALEQELAALRAGAARTPDDFASAVKHSLDSLQARLSETTNPVSNFVVREFSLEAKVAVDVSPLGVIDYRFVKPGESIDPSRLSKLALTIVPTPKPSSAHSFTATEFTPQVGVEQVQGIGEAWGKRLNAQGIYTVGDLVSAGSRVRSQAELAALLQVDRERLADWLAQAELLTVRDIDGRSAELLARTGAAGLEALATQTPETLTEAFNAENARKSDGRAPALTVEAAKLWIDTAKAWTGRGARVDAASIGAQPPGAGAR